MGIESRRRGATTILLLGVAAHGDQTDLRRLLAYAPPDLVPIELGQSDVQENHLRRKGPHGFEGLATGVGGARLVSFEGEQHAQRVDGVAVVVDDEDSASGGCDARGRSVFEPRGGDLWEADGHGGALAWSVARGFDAASLHFQ